MQTTNQKRYYGPQLSELAAIAVRRLAWAMGSNMGQAVDVMAQSLSGFIDPVKVCASCKDATKCDRCTFKNSGDLPQKAQALLY